MDQRSRVAALFDAVACEYDQTGVPFFSVFGGLLVQSARLAPGEQVLDVGAGRGAVTLPASEIVGPPGRVDAVDLSPAMVAELQRTVNERAITNVTVRCEDIQELKPTKKAYDAVTAALVLFFLADPAEGLRRLHRALRPGGRLVMSTFGEGDRRWSWLRELAALAPEEARSPVRLPGTNHTHFDSSDSVAKLLESCGFVAVRSEMHEHVTPFDSAAEWKRWSMTQGQRMLLSSIADDRRAEADELIDSRLEEMRQRDGAITLRTQLRITSGVRPD